MFPRYVRKKTDRAEYLANLTVGEVHFLQASGLLEKIEYLSPDEPSDFLDRLRSLEMSAELDAIAACGLEDVPFADMVYEH